MLMASPVIPSADVTPAGRQSPETPPKKLLRPSELPIYDTCHCHEQRPLPTTTITALERDIARVRLVFVGSLDALAGTKYRAVHFYDTGKAHTLDAVAYLREESNLLARVGAIFVGGLTGTLFVARRGFFKKLIFGGGGMAAVASLCYPSEAGQISRSAYTIAKYYAYVTYLKLEGEVRARSSSLSSPNPQPSISPPIDKIKDKDAVVPASKQKLPKVTGDFGQGHPEDADLYTTRSS